MGRNKAVAIVQSNYIPWKGYFDIISSVDEFVIFDEVQFTRRDWRNRNKIVLQGMPRWLTIPVKTKGRYDGAVDEIEVDGSSWPETHWKTIVHAYGKSQFYGEYQSVLEAAYEKAANLLLLTDINELFLRTITDLLDLKTIISRSRSVLRQAETPTERLIELCMAREATMYLSGPSARAYIETEKFEVAGVELRYADYSGYPIYCQQSDSFEHGVSMIDVLMRCGPAARSHLKSSKNRDGLLAKS